MVEAVIVLKHEQRMRAHRGIRRIPVDAESQVDIKIGHHRLAIQGHVRRRREIRFLDVLQLIDQRLLRRASPTRIPLQRAFVDHDRKGESGMLLRLRHHQAGRLVDAVARPVPVDDHAVDPAADHVGDLVMDLVGIDRTVADVDVARLAPPHHHVRIHPRRVARIQQRMHIHLADVSRAPVAVNLRSEAVGRTCIVSGQRSDGSGGNDVAGTAPTHTRQCQKRDSTYQSCRTHGVLRAGSCLGSCMLVPSCVRARRRHARCL